MSRLPRQFAVLLWKDWRQTRALFLALAVGGPLFVCAAWAYGDRAGRGGPVSEAAAAVVLSGAVVLGATAFAGERRRGTLAFLVEAPVPRWQVVASKTLLCVLLWLGVVACASLAGRLCAPAAEAVVDVLDLRRPLHFLTAHPHTWPGFALASLRALPILLCCLVLSTSVRRPIVAVLLGVVASCALVLVWAALAPVYWTWGRYLVGASRGMPSAWHILPALRVPVTAALCLWLVGLSAWLFERVREGGASGWRRAALLAKALGVTLAVFALPLPVGLVAEWTACARLRPEDAQRVSVLIASRPTGRRLVFKADFAPLPLSGDAARACVLDTETGEARLLAPHRESAPATMLWSPGGRYAAYHSHKGWLRKLPTYLHRCVSGRDYTYEPRLWLYDAEADASMGPVGPHIYWLHSRGWLGKDRMVVQGLSVERSVYSVASGALHPVRLPVPSGDGNGRRWVWWVHHTTDGTAYFWEGLGGRVHRVAWYDEASGRWVVHDVPLSLWPPELSSDGRYALLAVPAGEGGNVGVELHDLRVGSRQLLQQVEADDREHMGFIFSPDSRWVLLSLEGSQAPQRRGAWLFSVRTGQRLAPRLPQVVADRGPTFTPDSERLVWRNESGWYGSSEAREPRFLVYGIAAGRLRPLPITRDSVTHCYWGAHSALTSRSLFFTTDGAAIYRIQLDGTGLERVFPGRQPLALAEFEADVVSRRPR